MLLIMIDNLKLIFIIFIFFFFLGCQHENKKKIKSKFWIDEQKVYWEELLNKNEKWYSSNYAVSIADNILIYQHPTGGWPKNIDYKTPITFVDKIKIISDMLNLKFKMSMITKFSSFRFFDCAILMGPFKLYP